VPTRPIHEVGVAVHDGVERPDVQVGRLRYDREPGVRSYAQQGEDLVARTLFTAGISWPGVMLWDDIRTVDYLAMRPEVDAKRIGCAGHSGGGTQAMYLSCADERIQCAVISEGGLGHNWPIDPGRARLPRPPTP
jgi:dienelactone hydrolase